MSSYVAVSFIYFRLTRYIFGYKLFRFTNIVYACHAYRQVHWIRAWPLAWLQETPILLDTYWIFHLWVALQLDLHPINLLSVRKICISVWRLLCWQEQIKNTFINQSLRLFLLSEYIWTIGWSKSDLPAREEALRGTYARLAEISCQRQYYSCSCGLWLCTSQRDKRDWPQLVGEVAEYFCLLCQRPMAGLKILHVLCAEE